jgi:hypothetical protein
MTGPHLCTVAPARIDPLQAVGIAPDTPQPYWGWGAIPDQYGRTFDGDDGDTDLPSNPELTDLHHCDRTGDPATRIAGSAPLRTTDGSRSVAPHGPSTSAGWGASSGSTARPPVC